MLTDDATHDPGDRPRGSSLVLVVVDEQRSTRHLLPPRGTIAVGRGREVDVRVRQPWVSRVHVAIHVDGDDVTVEDTGSSYGTLVRGLSISRGERVAVGLGDLIEIGPTLLVVQRRTLPGPAALDLDGVRGLIRDECERAARLGLAFDVVAVELVAKSTEAVFDALSTATSLRFGHDEHVCITGASRPVTAPRLDRRVEEQLAARAVDAAVGVSTSVPQGGGEPHGDELIERALRGFASLRSSSPEDENGSLPGTLVFGPSSQALHERIIAIARTSANVIIEGERGTGKDMIARLLHQRSGHAGPTSRLVGGELVDVDSLERITSGMLVLDEVELVPAEMQSRLAEHLRRTAAELRVVALTRREDLRSAIREDLFATLAGAGVKIPALRERSDDVGVLAAYFARVGAAIGGKRRLVTIAADVLELLQAHPWPGNVRELRSAVVPAAAAAAGAQLLASDIPVLVRAGGAPDLRGQLATLERQRILDALERCNGNQSAAARVLGMPRNTLLARLRDYDLPRPRKPRRG